MFIFFMLVLTAIAIAVVVWLYLYLSRRALDNSMSAENAAKPLVRSPRTAGGKAWENPVSAGAGSTASQATGTTQAESATPVASAAAAPGTGAAAGVTGSTSGKGRKPAKSGTKAAKATKTPKTAGASGPASSTVASGKGGKGGKSGKSGKGTKPAKAGGKARGATARTEASATPPVSSLAAMPPKAPDEPLFTAPAGAKDRLTDIKGIGPVAERQLNEQGITTFAQIAALTAKDIVRIDAYMPFSDRQIRDWQKQAKKKA